MRYKTTSKERQICVFPKPRTYMMFEAETKMKVSGKSEHAKRILDAYYDSKTPSEQAALLEYYEKNIKPWKKAS